MKNKTITLTKNSWFFKFLWMNLSEFPCLFFKISTVSGLDMVLSRQPISFRYHNRAALVMSALQVEKNPLCAPGPCTPVGVHSNYAIPRWRLPAHSIHAALTLSPPRGVRPAPNSPKMKLRFNPNIHNFSFSPSLDARCCYLVIVL